MNTKMILPICAALLLAGCMNEIRRDQVDFYTEKQFKKVMSDHLYEEFEYLGVVEKSDDHVTHKINLPEHDNIVLEVTNKINNHAYSIDGAKLADRYENDLYFDYTDTIKSYYEAERSKIDKKYGFTVTKNQDDINAINDFDYFTEHLIYYVHIDSKEDFDALADYFVEIDQLYSLSCEERVDFGSTLSSDFVFIDDLPANNFYKDEECFKMYGPEYSMTKDSRLTKESIMEMLESNYLWAME